MKKARIYYMGFAVCTGLNCCLHLTLKFVSSSCSPWVEICATHRTHRLGGYTCSYAVCTEPENEW